MLTALTAETSETAPALYVCIAEAAVTSSGGEPPPPESGGHFVALQTIEYC